MSRHENNTLIKSPENLKAVTLQVKSVHWTEFRSTPDTGVTATRITHVKHHPVSVQDLVIDS